MKKYETSRGWRNKNPLNIRRTLIKWDGQCYEQTDKDFCQFISMTFGFRAAVKCLFSYYSYFKQRGRDWSVDNILNRWAPKSENMTDVYIARVLALMGRQPADVRLADPNTTPGLLQLAALVAAMTCVETGCPPQAVPLVQLNIGFVFAGYPNPHLDANWWS